MRLVKAVTMHAAVQAVEKWVEEPRRRPADLHDDDRGGPGMSTMDDLIEGVDPALAAAVLEIESHIADGGWDQPARLYALVDTAELVRQRARPGARRWGSTSRGRGLADAGRAGPDRAGLRPRAVPRVDHLAARRGRLRGRGRAAGAAAGRRRPSAGGPDRADDVRPRAPGPPGGADRRGRHPRRCDVLCPAAARRTTTTSRCVGGADLVPGLLALLGATLEDPDPGMTKRLD